MKNKTQKLQEETFLTEQELQQFLKTANSRHLNINRLLKSQFQGIRNHKNKRTK